MEIFHPLIARWFDEKYGEPTDIQTLAWPRIARGENLLVTAPTGSGKTLAAFLWSINRFTTGALETGATRVLYVSPLKALNNDIRKNLVSPLQELEDLFQRHEHAFPAIRIQTRSGDTDASVRRKMLRVPPEILITTPESLNLLLSSRGGLSLLESLDTVILDEIHAVAGSKRGAYLMSAVERLVRYSGEFQRIALSATVNPVDDIARLVGGYRYSGGKYLPRQISVLQSSGSRAYQLSIRYPPAAASRDKGEKIWEYLSEDFYRKILKNQSTLLFVNSRALCEKLAFMINSAAGDLIAYAHHGSLSREVRLEVEQRLKAGTLSAIVATSTLELGIDIGELDEVILVQSPASIAASVQRIGRSGHEVDGVSKGTIYPTHPHDFIEAAALCKGILDQDIEPTRIIECPLDVLAQIIISATATETRDIDDLYQELRLSTPFQPLTRQHFSLVLDMLAGRYAGHHIQELKPRIIVDRISNTVTARKGSVLSLYLSGGVIPDRGYFQLRLADSNARLGELDEEFVWEAGIGQIFTLGTQSWQVRKITHNDVIVSPATPSKKSPPFWKAEPVNRNFHYAERIGKFLEEANERLDSPGFREDLIHRYHVEDEAAEQIIEYLLRQRHHTATELPHRHHLLMEKISVSPGNASGEQIVLHTGWGAMVNRPFALALEAGWEREYGEQPEIHVSNESLVIQQTSEMTAQDLMRLVPADRLPELIRSRIESSGFFCARFRENAGRALLLSRGRFNERKPLWMSRLQSRKLMDSVRKFEDFPILLETWRTCMKDEFDLPALRRLLDEIATNRITLTEIRVSSPSPFAQSLSWRQINSYMYQEDQPVSRNQSSLKSSLLDEIIDNPQLRPRLPHALIESFETKQLRLASGYQPRDAPELVEWVKERSAIPQDEWNALTASSPAAITFQNDKLGFIERGVRFVVALEDRDHFLSLFEEETEDSRAGLEILIGNWLQYYGPRSLEFLTTMFRLSADRLLPVLDSLVESGELVTGPLLEGDDTEYWCHHRNYEFLLRLRRQDSRVHTEPLSLSCLTPFLFEWQSRFGNDEPVGQIVDVIEQLRYLPGSAALWETEWLPARIRGYDPQSLDLLFQEGDIRWIGTGEKQITFCFRGEEELIPALSGEDPGALFPDTSARYDFASLLDRTGQSAAVLSDRLWKAAWESRVSTDSFRVVRQAIANGFSVPDAKEFTRHQRRRSVRSGFNRWRGTVSFSGTWFLLPKQESKTEDLLEQEELNKDRARVLLDRYGIVFRELLAREHPTFQWRALYRSLRLMELSGEVLSGYFFSDIPGPQYISPKALTMLKRVQENNRIFWINATDPSSSCGLGLAGLAAELPRRTGSSHIVYHGSRIVLVSARQGKALTFFVDEDNDHLSEYLGVLRHLIYRSFQPLRKLEIETINEMPARSSPWLPVIENCFQVVKDHRSVYIERKI